MASESVDSDMASSQLVDEAVASVLNAYRSTSFKPPAMQYTVAASFFLTRPSSPGVKVISVATGTKCLPTVRLPTRGEALHDSHAEVLARRGAIRWFLEEIGRCHSNTPYDSDWICKQIDGKHDLQKGAQIGLYISTIPCGDASTNFLASVQDEEMAKLKDFTVYAPVATNATSRGRDNYSLLGVLRTKPGRADSPPTLSMSCSDKIASWSILGFQGALATTFLRPLYLSTIVVGEVPIAMRDTVRVDCERAMWRRLEDVRNLPPGYSLHRPNIRFTSLPFSHSHTILNAEMSTNGSCNESLCWIAESKPHEVLIHGLKRGVSPKHRYREKSRPRVSKIALYQLVNETMKYLGGPLNPPTATYFEVKHSMLDYQAAKEALVGNSGPFCGWAKSGARWEIFNANGEHHEHELG